MNVYLNSIEKDLSFGRKIYISSSIIFSQHHDRIQIFNEDVKVNNNFTLNGSGVKERSLK